MKANKKIKELKKNISKLYDIAQDIELEPFKDIDNIGEFSDGYHTFNELYEFRKVYNASLFNEWAKQKKYDVHKSKKHFDGELCFGGYFIVVAILPTGQISNHYELKEWYLFQCEETEKAKYEFDGHTPQDVIKRLKELIKIK